MARYDFQDWIGREVRRRDVVTQRIVEQFRATLSPFFADVECPPGLHWCLAVPAHPPENLGPDGAERKGLFIPPIDMPVRRWGGGALRSQGAFRIGDNVERISRVASVLVPPRAEKAFAAVTVEHVFSVKDAVILRESQDLIFLASGHERKQPERMAQDQLASHDRHWKVRLDESTLARFSAVTFNGHRIHYDKAFAAEEGQPGVLVHGPLQASLLLNQFAILNGSVPRDFSYRCVSPLVVPQSAQVVSRRLATSGEGFVLTEDGLVTTRGTAMWM